MKEVDKISLKHWAIYLTHTTVSGEYLEDTWINLVSPKEMEDFYEKTRCGVDIEAPERIKGKVILNGIFNESELIKHFNPLELMTFFYYIVPIKWGSKDCVPVDYDDMRYLFEGDYKLFYRFHNERITMRLDYNSQHLNDGVIGLKKNIADFIRHADLSKL